jgi:adenine-specific DNA methylase
MTSSYATKRLVEDVLPLDKVNRTARVESGFIRVPKISNLHPYLARRPTAPARALTLASVLPAGVPMEEFERALGLDRVESVPYRILYLVNPDRRYVEGLVRKYTDRSPREIVVVDPMAGGGSIPLESLRLGFRTIAVEYNPVAYLILKATLEYPAKYSIKLYEAVRVEVEKLLEWARREFSQYYPQDAYNYIIARGYRCPNCKGLIPIIYGNRLSKDGPYIDIVVDGEKKVFTIRVSPSETPFERLRCPYCRMPVNEDVALRSWVKKHKELLNIALSGDVEEAKRRINELLETHVILVKETPQGFRPANDNDKEFFVKAFIDLTTQINELRDFLPDARIPRENEVFEPVRGLGIEYWYELFNPRQLLILLKLMKYVRERAGKLVKEKGEFGAAITLYLALGLNKIADYNNITTRWDPSQSSINGLAGRYQDRGRRVDLGLEYCEMPPIVRDPGKSLGWVFEPHIKSIGRTAGGILPVLRLLSEWLGGLGNLVDVLCGDARRLDLMLKNLGVERVDIINVDPPYLAQHFYSDLMEFYWQTLRVVLQPVIDDGYQFNRDPGRGKVELYIDGWSPYLATLPRSEEIIARRGRDKISELGEKSISAIEENPFTGDWYVLKMWEFFEETRRILKDDGALIVWFTHSDPRAWEAIISSLYAARFILSRAWPIWTEMRTREVAHLTSAFFTSLALVLRKRETAESVVTSGHEARKLIYDESVRKIIKSSVIESIVGALNSGASGSEVFIMGLAGGIAGATRIWNPDIDELTIKERQETQKTSTGYVREMPVEELLRESRFRKALMFFDKILYPIAMYLGLEALLEDYLKKNGLSEEMIRNVLGVDAPSKAYLILWTATRYAESGELSYDFVEKVCKITGVNIQVLAYSGLLVRPQRSGQPYGLPFGSECYGAVRNEIDKLVRTVAGQAIHLLRLIGEQPKDDILRAIRGVLSTMPVSRSAVATALFLLRTARDEELQLVRLSSIAREFADNMLVRIYHGEKG